jgi:hypothetical protein
MRVEEEAVLIIVMLVAVVMMFQHEDMEAQVVAGTAVFRGEEIRVTAGL